MSQTEENGKPARPALIPQPHGRGALYAGGVPGNKGGIGSIPSILRRKIRRDFEANYRIAVEIAQDETATNADRLRALDLLARYSLGSKVEVTGEDWTPVEIDVESLRREILKRLPSEAHSE